MMKETVPKFAKLFEKYMEEFSPKESKFIVGEEVSIFHHIEDGIDRLAKQGRKNLFLNRKLLLYKTIGNGTICMLILFVLVLVSQFHIIIFMLCKS